MLRWLTFSWNVGNPVLIIKLSPILPHEVRYNGSHDMPMVQRAPLLQRCKSLRLASPQDICLP